MRVTCGFAPVNGTHLYYETAGEGSALVLVHGLGLDARVWDDQFEAFAERHRVVRYDVRGFGRSAPPDAGRFRHADDLRALLDFLEMPKSHVLGLCVGGRIAIHHALIHPGATLSLILVDASLDGDRWTVVLSGDSRDMRAELGRLAEAYPAWDAPRADAGVEPRASDRLHEIHMPVLVIAGERVRSQVQRISDMLARGIPEARKVVMMGAGQLCNLERAQAFNAIVLSFLDVAEAARERA